MSHRAVLWGWVSLNLFTLSALGQTMPATATSEPAASQPATAAATSEPAVIDNVQTWVADAASENALMLEGGKLAAERASDPQVKQFAQTLVVDRAAAQSSLSKAASTAGVPFDGSLTPVAAARLDQLRRRHGTDFDRIFLFAVVGEATRANLDYSYEIGKGDSKPVQDYARTTLPKIQQELSRATALATPIAGSMAMTPGSLDTPAQPAIPMPTVTTFPAVPTEPTTMPAGMPTTRPM